HELGHSIESKPLEFPISIGTVIILQDPDLVSLYRRFARRSKFKQEAFAWINSRRFLDISNKETFYFVMRFFLETYKDYTDFVMEECLIEFRDSLHAKN